MAAEPDPDQITVQLRITLPGGPKLTKTLAADPAWRQALDLPLREYVNLILHRATSEAHRWVTAHTPAEDTTDREDQDHA